MRALRCALTFALVISGLSGGRVLASTTAFDLDDVFTMSLEDLMQLRISSVSKTSESMHDVATSIYVITEEDIRRSGATRLTELLNLVPGAWFQDLTYNVTTNGLRAPADEFPQSMRILLDGVPITNPITGGPMYNYLHIPVRQIERIELIKGPGGTIYGANANTGIVSIYTKEAEQAERVVCDLSAGMQDQISPFVRIGARVAKSVELSAFADYLTTRGYDQTDDFVGSQLNVIAPTGADSTIENRYTSDDTDGLEALAGGLQLQADLSADVRSSSRLFCSSTASKVYTYAKILDSTWVANQEAIDVIASQRLDLSLGRQHSLFLQVYFRNQTVEVANDGGWEPTTRMLACEFQDNVRFGQAELCLGGNYEHVKFDHDNGPYSDMTYMNTEASYELTGGFAQGTWHHGNLAKLVLGVKAEKWTLVGSQIEASPSARLTVKPSSNLTIWSALSRSVTTPGYFHLNLEHRFADLAGDGSLYLAIVPDDHISPTKYITTELGLRAGIGSRGSIDVSGFHAKVDDAIGVDPDFQSKEPIPSRSGGYMVLPMYFTNTYEGHAYGGEVILRVDPWAHLRAELSYSHYQIDTEGLPIPGDGRHTPPRTAEPRTPKHVIRLRPYLDLPNYGIYVTLSALWASKSYRGEPYDYVAQKASDDTGWYEDPPEELLKIDLNIEKRFAGDRLSINLWGRNLLADDYVEFYSGYLAGGYPHTVHRTFGAGIRYRLDR